MKNQFFYVDSKLLFIYILGGVIISLICLLEFIYKKDMWFIIASLFMALFFIFSCYIFSFSIEFFKEEFTVKRLFGLGNTSIYKSKDVQKIIFKTDYTELISNIKIYFKNGKSIQIHKFQKNFGEALYVIKDEFKDVPIEYKDKSDFFY